MDLELTWLQPLKVVLVRGAVALGLGFWHWRFALMGITVWFPGVSLSEGTCTCLRSGGS